MRAHARPNARPLVQIDATTESLPRRMGQRFRLRKSLASASGLGVILSKARASGLISSDSLTFPPPVAGFFYFSPPEYRRVGQIYPRDGGGAENEDPDRRRYSYEKSGYN